MEVKFTNIPDINDTNIDEAKVDFADNIIEQTYPLFDNELSRVSEQLEIIKEEIKYRDKRIKQEKDELSQLLYEFESKKKVLGLVNRIERLIGLGAGTDGSLRHELIVLLKVCDTMKDKSLDDNLQRLKSILKKRYSSNG